MSAENKLNQLFENARTAEPQVDLASIEKQVNQKGNNSSKTSITTKTIITMSVFLVICSSLYLFFSKSNQEVKQVEKPIPVAISHDKSSNTHLIEAAEKKQIGLGVKTLPSKKTQFHELLNSIATTTFSEAIPQTLIQKKNEKVMPIVDTTYTYRTINISSIKVIELTNDELKNLGITVADKNIKIPIGEDPLQKSIFSKEGTTLEFKINFKQNGWDSILNEKEKSNRHKKLFLSNTPTNFIASASPILIDLGDTSNKLEEGKPIPHYSLITDDLGQKWRVYEVDDGLSEEDKKYMRDNNLSPFKWEKAIKGRKEGERKLIEKIPSFIPVLVRSGDSNSNENDSTWRTDIIIWFEPSEDLFNALPERISKDLRKEYQSVFMNKKVDTKTCNYFEACQNTPGAINSFSAFPNPTDSELTVEFNLSESRSIEATIYSINGMLLKKALPSKSFEMGKHKFETNIGDLLPGVYLLVIESDKGDVISRRIVRR